MLCTATCRQHVAQTAPLYRTIVQTPLVVEPLVCAARGPPNGSEEESAKTRDGNSFHELRVGRNNQVVQQARQFPFQALHLPFLCTCPITSPNPKAIILVSLSMSPREFASSPEPVVRFVPYQCHLCFVIVVVFDGLPWQATRTSCNKVADSDAA